MFFATDGKVELTTWNKELSGFSLLPTVWAHLNTVKVD